ncbi:Hsp20/alpha crystallin family protein [Pueribacillus theae]|uniref:Hsp20/alpha crystallin family protein n=1 Tax=Pueribacillus theae TaxID=2171751 RepID=A0A2U1JTJ7_9BACI|nr:Hsp20/alpha crystallin family protein [Pueribacillus theae]PWA08274.1 Hsp20/alpha crystallin family protein [Pueribacillus theae]
MSTEENKFPKIFNDQKFTELFSIFDQWFEDPLGSFFVHQIKVDMYERGQDLIIEADVPGVKKEQINLEWFPDGLKITAENRSELEETNQKEKYYRKERFFNRRERFIPLTLVSSPKNIKARYENGILRIQIPKYNLKQYNRKMIDIE